MSAEHDATELQNEVYRLEARVAELEAERERLIKHLSAIERVSNDSRSQSRRMQYITARARSAINGDDDWKGMPRPRKGSPEGTIDHLQHANFQLREENARLWAWHDAVMAQPDYVAGVAIIRPQPLTKGK